jgi:hypothetical protein
VAPGVILQFYTRELRPRIEVSKFKRLEAQSGADRIKIHGMGAPFLADFARSGDFVSATRVALWGSVLSLKPWNFETSKPET